MLVSLHQSHFGRPGRSRKAKISTKHIDHKYYLLYIRGRGCSISFHRKKEAWISGGGKAGLCWPRIVRIATELLIRRVTRGFGGARIAGRTLLTFLPVRLVNKLRPSGELAAPDWHTLIM